MDIQRLRNLTTGFLHTKMDDIYQDIATLTRADGIMSHQLPNAAKAMEPWLLPDSRFWDYKHDPSHVGDVEIEPMNDDEKNAMFARFAALPSPLAGKEVLVVKV